MMPGMVSTVGPVSKVNPASRSCPHRPPGRRSLDDGDLVAAPGEVAGRRQPGQAGADDDDGAARAHRSRRARSVTMQVSPATPSGDRRRCPAPRARPRCGRRSAPRPRRRRPCSCIASCTAVTCWSVIAGEPAASSAAAAAPCSSVIARARAARSACRSGGRRPPACRSSAGSPHTPSRSSRSANASPACRP